MNHNPFRTGKSPVLRGLWKSYHLWFVGCTSTEFTPLDHGHPLRLLPAKQKSFGTMNGFVWEWGRSWYTMVDHGIPWHKSPEWQFERVFPLGFGCFGGYPKLSDKSGQAMGKCCMKLPTQGPKNGWNSNEHTAKTGGFVRDVLIYIVQRLLLIEWDMKQSMYWLY